MKIELELDLDKYLASHVGYDEDGEPVQEPTTLEDVVIGLAARQLSATVINAEAKTYLTEQVRLIRTEEIRAVVRPAIEKALVASVQPSDHYGTPKGEPVTLAEAIEATVKKMLTENISRGYNEPKRTLVQQWIHEAVNHRVSSELAAALADGKAQVKKALQDQGARLLSDAIAKMAQA